MKLCFLKSFYCSLFFILLAGCMAHPAYREGKNLLEEGQEELALKRFAAAAAEAPRDAEYLAAYVRLRERLISRWLDQGLAAQRVGQNSEAEKSFRKVLVEDANNSRAQSGLADLARNTKHQILITEAESAIKFQEYDVAASKLRVILGENPEQARALDLKRQIDETLAQSRSQPRLSGALKKPLTIEFKDAPLRQIFEVISRTSGLNFVFDKDVRGEQRATIFLRNTTIHDALNLLLLTNQLEQRVLDENSILIYPNTLAKQKDYQPLTVKSFFLSNIDVKTAEATLKSIARTKDIVVDEKQNLITIRDTPDAVRMAEKLLAVHDQPDPEVMLEVTVLEVTRSRLLNLGIQWPDQLSLAPLAGSNGSVTLADLKALSASTTSATISPLTANLTKTDGDSKILANPRIRAHNRESAKIMIGDRIPNITTTSTATGFVSENIQYIDVGLKLEVQPTVYADNEIAIKIALEVSSIANITQTKSGSLAYQIGTRNATTLLRLKDGENQVLAGLIRDDGTYSGNKIPGLGDLPILGRLFGRQNDKDTKTEIVLSITPHLIRSARRPDFSITEFDSGSESMLRVGVDGLGSTPQKVKRSASISPGSATSVRSVEPEGITEWPLISASSLSMSPPPLGQTEIKLEGPNQTKTGGNFTVQLAIQPNEPVTSIPFALTFDPKVLEIIAVTEGDFLKQGQGNTNFSNRVDRNGGQIFATATRAGQDGVLNSGNVVTIGFKAISPATDSRIQVSAIAPIGLKGRAVSVKPTSPLVITVTP